MKIVTGIKSVILNILKSPKLLIDLIRSIVVELGRVEWLSLGKLVKSTAIVLFYATILGVSLYALDRLFEFLIIEKILKI